MTFLHNLRIFTRLLLRNKKHYFINIGALAVSIATFIIILSYVYSQNNFDSFHENYDRIFRLINVRHYPSKIDQSAGCIEIAGIEMKSSFPEIEDYAHCQRKSHKLLFHNQEFMEKNIYYVSPSFLKIFSFPIIEGTKENYLISPYTCMITQKTARKYFGNDNPIGKQIDFNLGKLITIEGILKDLPSNSYFNFDFLLSYSTVHSLGYCETCNNKNTFLLLAENTDKENLESKFPALIQRIHPDDEIKREYFLQPLNKFHTTTNYRFELGTTKNGKILIYLKIIGLLILLISWLNYMSVNTIVAFKRFKECGIKVISGASSRSILFQFLTDSIHTTMIATILGFVIAMFLIPSFKNQLDIKYFMVQYKSIIVTIAIMLVGAFSATFFIFAIYNKSKGKNLSDLLKVKNLNPGITRVSFVIFQNLITIVLITFTLMIFKQYKFMTESELGCNINNVLVINNYLNKPADRTFMQNIRKLSFVEDAGFSSYLLGTENGNVGGGFRMEGQNIAESIQLYEEAVSNNYMKMMGMEIVAGRTINDTEEPNSAFTNRKSDEIILNESACWLLGFTEKEKAIGKTIIRENRVLGRIVGIVEDSHQKSLDNPILPIFYRNTNYCGHFYIKLNSEPSIEALTIIKKEYKKLSPQSVYDSYFLTDQFEKQYLPYTNFAKLVLLFTILSILICCVGLFSLSKYIILMRTKEIGIRKVNGAKAAEIIRLLSSDYLKWILIAFVFACVISFYALNKWLEGFAYKSTLSWWIFILAGIIALMISMFTVSFQTFMAANRNPIKALRYE